MMKEQVNVSKEVRDVKAAQWEGFKWLARQLPNHHILGVELIRTRHDETAAVFTVVKNQEPVQYVVFGDSLGRVKAHDTRHLTATSAWTASTLAAKSTLAATAPPPEAAPDGMALGDPPPKQPPPPGIVSLAAVVLAASFDMGEQISEK